MVLIGFSDTLSLTQSIGIIGTMVLTLYFSKRHIQALKSDEKTRVLNDLDEKFQKVAEIFMTDPSVRKVINAQEYVESRGVSDREMAFSFYVLYTCYYAYWMRQRRVLDEDEWAGWLRWMRNCFLRGTMGEIWKKVESDEWFNPAFQKFINTELVRA
jgi:hypothetical protein